MRDSVMVADRSRTYTVVGPRESSHARDLVLIFHGSKQTGDVHRAFTGRSFDAMADSGAAVVVYLDGHKGNWNDARRESYFPARQDNVDDVGFVRAVIRKLAASHRIDTDRVLAVGYSNGGQMVMRLVHETPELIAGAAVFGATMPVPDSFLLPQVPPAAVPMLLIHGTKDPIVRYEGGRMSWWARKLFKVGGESLSTTQTARYFAERNGITGEPFSTTLPATAGTTSVERTEYRGQDRPPVVLYTVHGGGHTIPGPAKAPAMLGRTNQDISAAELVAELFEASR